MAGFLIIAALTGSLLVFYYELDELLNPQFYRAVDGGRTLSAAQLVAKIEQQIPSRRVVDINLPRKPGETARLRTNPIPGLLQPANSDEFDELYADPVSGEILGQREWGAIALDAPHLMPMIYSLHYSLLTGHIGMFVFGIIALLWFFDCFVGFYLTLPRGKSFWKKWKLAWQVKFTARFGRINFDLHRASGLWLWPVLAVLAFSGAYFNLYDELFIPALKKITTLSPSPAELRPARASSAQNFSLSYDDAILRAQRALAEREIAYEKVGRFKLDAERGIYAVFVKTAERIMIHPTKPGHLVK